MNASTRGNVRDVGAGGNGDADAGLRQRSQAPGVEDSGGGEALEGGGDAEDDVGARTGVDLLDQGPGRGEAGLNGDSRVAGEGGQERTFHGAAEGDGAEQGQGGVSGHGVRAQFWRGRGRCRSGCGPMSGWPRSRPSGVGVPAGWGSNRLDQGVLDAEDGVAGVDLGVSFDEDVRHEGPQVLGGDHEVQVGGADGGAAGRTRASSRRARRGDRVGGGGESPERVPAVLVGEEVGAAGDARVGVLDVVEAVLVGFPDFDPGAGDGVAVGVGDGTFDPAGLAVRAAGDVAAEPGFRGRRR